MNFGLDKRMVKDNESDGEMVMASKKKLGCLHLWYNMANVRPGDEHKLYFLHCNIDLVFLILLPRLEDENDLDEEA